MRARGAAQIQKAIRIPKPLVEEVEQFIECRGRGESINDFIVEAVQLRLSILKRKDLDAELSEMSNDPDYQRDAQLIAQDFETSDRETGKLLDQ